MPFSILPLPVAPFGTCKVRDLSPVQAVKAAQLTVLRTDRKQFGAG